MNFFKKMLVLCLMSSFVNVALAQRTASFWADSRYWMLENNEPTSEPLRQDDYDILSSISLNGGAIMSTAYSAHGSEIPQGAAALFYLAEMGLAILRNDRAAEAEAFLNGTGSVREFYKDYAYKNVAGEYGMGRLVNSQARIVDTQSTIPLNQSLAFNYNAAYAYFLAVRGQLSERYGGGQSFGDVSMAFKVYRYLHTQISVSTHGGEKFIKWKYGEHRPDGSADDTGHAGLGARSLAYGSKFNFSWQWWSNMLFGNNKMASKIIALKPTNMDFTGNLADENLGELAYWKLPYPN